MIRYVEPAVIMHGIYQILQLLFAIVTHMYTCSHVRTFTIMHVIKWMTTDYTMTILLKLVTREEWLAYMNQ